MSSEGYMICWRCFFKNLEVLYEHACCLNITISSWQIRLVKKLVMNLSWSIPKWEYQSLRWLGLQFWQETKSCFTNVEVSGSQWVLYPKRYFRVEATSLFQRFQHTKSSVMGTCGSNGSVGLCYLKVGSVPELAY